MRSNAQRQYLRDDLPELPKLSKFSPQQLCTGCGMVNFSLEPLSIDKIIFIWIQQLNGRFQIILELCAVLPQIVQQANEFALLMQTDFASKRTGQPSNARQMVGQ